ncbi:MAG: hypothetical protein KA143_13330, partial [Saprospiraceae bacterium]|nr:hypothetical protein [Saprospiraceae bacterium]
ITVMLTPLSADSKGIAVLNKTSGGFVAQELFAGSGNYEFDYEVKGIRKGYENEPVIVSLNQGNKTSFINSPDNAEKFKEQLLSVPAEAGERKGKNTMNTTFNSKPSYTDFIQKPEPMMKKKLNTINQ